VTKRKEKECGKEGTSIECEIWGSESGVHEDSSILWYCVMPTGDTT